ncbi:MAG: pyrroloquinoline quinone-dependent dehydrogenase [Bryobacterales bacterium]|nr:pyrroloquinoline quinone-dependent dehydrogenase [Bryobacterales bacterium]MBV9398323.1 pyrroloquinoline quinone-dependent dehydrogenase [Bryobacterales bacterium]
MRIKTILTRSLIVLPALAAGIALAQNDWPVYGRDPGAQRYSPLTQINPGNVSQLVEAWRYQTRPASETGKAKESKSTPLMVNDVLYFATPYQSLIAVEPETGKKIWSFDHQHAPRTSRGIAYWPGARNAPPTIFFGTEDGFLIGVNARTGKLVPGFAKEGELDLKQGMKGDGLENAPYGLNGAPAIYKNLVFTGSHLQDYGSYGGRGDIRAWDAATGKIIWTFHTVPQPGEPGHETWLDDGWKNRSGANVWSTFSVDPQTGTLLMPIGSPSDDRYGGDRPGANLFGNSLVAVDAMTGKVKWYFQAVHHDLWDYDLPPQPTLVDVIKDGQKIPALIQGSKMGLIFILDRRTGKPIFGLEERPVPKGDVPGEWYSPTQPFPLKPPQLARATWKKDEITRFTPEQGNYCEELFKNAQNDGPYAPVRLTDTVVFPGPDGGFNWGGGSYDPKLGYYFINSHDRGGVQKMVAQVPAKERPKGQISGAGDPSQMPFIRQNVGPITNPATGWPCQSPPWGELFAINVNTAEVAWRIPFGRVESLEKIGVMNTGSYNIGGSVATASGLLFIGATDDQRFHAYESKNGKLLWETKLPANGYANPITYLGKDGKQYVVIVAQETVVAYRLP